MTTATNPSHYDHVRRQLPQSPSTFGSQEWVTALSADEHRAMWSHPVRLSGFLLILQLMFVQATLAQGDPGSLLPSLFYPEQMFSVHSGFCGVGGLEVVATGDVTLDGIPDLIVVHACSLQVQLFCGAGDGTFALCQTLSVSGNPPGYLQFASAVIADLNVDGFPDVAVASIDIDHLAVFLGQGDGTLGPELQGSLAVGIYSGLIPGDYDSDGIPDLLGVSPGSGDLRVMLGLGDGTFATGPSSPIPMAFTLSLIPGEFNEDGVPDIASISTDQPLGGLYHSIVSLGQGDGSFLAGQSWPLSGLTPAWGVSGDFNGDGHSDLIAGHSVSLGAGDGSFSAPQPLVVQTQGGLIARDINLDGSIDVTWGATIVVPGQGDGTFATPLPAASTCGIRGIEDLDLDGLPDAVTGCNDNVGVLLHLPPTPVIKAIQPDAGNLLGGNTVAISVSSPSPVENTQVYIGDQAATVLDVIDPGSLLGTVLAQIPAVNEVPSGLVEVRVDNANGTGFPSSVYSYTPRLSTSVSGDTVSGGTLQISWLPSPSAPPGQLIWLWFGVPGGFDLNATLAGFAGALHEDVFLMVLQAFPAFFQPLSIAFGPLPPGTEGFEFHMQAALTGEGKFKGSFTNVSTFAVP